MSDNKANPTFFSKSYTVQDIATQLESAHVVLDDCNIHVYNNDIYYGDGNIMEAIAVSGSVLSFRHIDLRYFFVKNRVAGQTATIVVTGVLEKEG